MRPKRARPSILVGEDEWLIARHLQWVLTSHGYDVEAIASRAADVLVLCERHRPDLLLLDISLEAPDAGLRLVEEHGLARRLSVIFVSAHSDPKTLERATRAGSRGFVTKPFVERDLLAAVARACARESTDG